MSYSPVDILLIRSALGLTQDAFAERLGVNRSNVSRWEAGVTQPRGPVCKLLDSIVGELRSCDKGRSAPATSRPVPTAEAAAQGGAR